MAKQKAKTATKRKTRSATKPKSKSTGTKSKTKSTSTGPKGKAKVGFHKWTAHVPGQEPFEVFPKEDNQASARLSLRKHLNVDALPAGSVVIKGCKVRSERKVSPEAKRRMRVLGEYTKMLWDADGRRKPITAYAKEAAREAKRDGKI